MVFYLFIITFIIYATFGLQSFESLFTFKWEDDVDDGYSHPSTYIPIHPRPTHLLPNPALATTLHDSML